MLFRSNIDRIAGNTAAAEGLQKSAFQRANTFEGMSKIEVVDKSTVRITMASPSSAWLKGFLEWRNVMMPKGIVEVGFKDPMAFASYGSFMMSEFVPNVREVFVKNPNYYRQGQPHLDKIVHTVVPDNAAAVAGFISKQFSILPSVTEQDIKTVKAARPDALYYQTPGSQWLYIWPSAKYGAFQDARVRKAMQLAIDYQEMGEGFYGPGCEYTGHLFSGYQEAWKPDKIKTLPGYNPATKAKDREDANKLMAAAGHPNGQGVDFEIITPTGTGVFAAHNDDALRFQSQMQKAFPQMKPVMKPIPEIGRAHV
mgnify:FL=1